ncbi:hypothetical protein J437_LFUL019220 [Ladona fulva]|uniref:Uncharacterized protein n=1 Tax=Ladona fulva TaxID=123851 RepID=A0A8K0P838_LADFU|nr:hypothetical protein J437_LFUL019220 [Ladona fulva]
MHYKEKRNAAEYGRLQRCCERGRERKSGGNVSCKCAFSCTAITLTYRRQLFEEFWKLNDYSKQQNYLLRLIHPQLIKRRIQWYHEIFLSKFNLSFQSPKVDTCSTCDSFAVKLKAGDTSVKVDQDLHHRQAEAAFKAMSDDEKNAKSSDAYVITFDLQQQMYIPQLTHSEMYYSHQVAGCNLGIHDSVTGTGCMCIWLENFGGRGSQKISSCVYKYLTMANLRGKTKLICWLDNCGGQN